MLTSGLRRWPYGNCLPAGARAAAYQGSENLLTQMRRDFPIILCEALEYASKRVNFMPIAKARASAILAEFHEAQAELIGKAVVLTDGKAGTVDHIWLDELHGLRISIRGHDGKWPISTIKLAQSDCRRVRRSPPL